VISCICSSLSQTLHMSWLVGCRAAAILQRGECSQARRSIPAYLDQLGLSSSKRTIQTTASPLSSKRYNHESSTRHNRIRGLNSDLPPARELRSLYRMTASKSFSSSASGSAKSEEPPQERKARISQIKVASPKVSPAQRSQTSPRQAIPERWKNEYDQKKTTQDQSRIENRAAAYRAGQILDQWVIWVIGGINVIIFLVWQFAENAAHRFKDPELYITMWQNFICSIPNLEAGRYWSILTSCFSHATLEHLAMNSITLAFLAPSVVTLLGPSAFASLYIGAGIGAAIFSLAWKGFVNPWINKDTWSKQRQAFERQAGGHGASGESFNVLSKYGPL
jgi:membrane associated rhomboid family serine protease